MTYLTTAEVAARLRISKETAQRRCRRGIIPALKDGKSFLVAADAFDAYVESLRFVPAKKDVEPTRRKRRGES